jgi:hypothetical protein
MGNIKTSNKMTPKEKAKELVYKFDDTIEFSTPQRFAKKCALITVDEILNTIEYSSQADELSKISYWEEVKNEINKL